MENIQSNADLNTGIDTDTLDNTDQQNPADTYQDHGSDHAFGHSEEAQEPEEDSRFKDGEELTLVRVRFPGNAKSFPFLVGKRKFQYGQKVMAMSDRGMTVGYINSFPYKVAFNKTMLPLRSIAREANNEDIRQQIEFHESEKRAEVICLRLIERYELDMVLTHVEFIQFGKKAVFYFNAPQRVDFRDLVKDLVQELKMRIELRQISVRDRAAALGSIGACGLQTCCSSFLKNYGNVSIKMAKNQNLALIPSKLNGVCGQIKCCIKYEDDVYNDKRKNLPKEGSIIEAANGDRGRVFRLHLLIEQFEMLTDNGIKRRYASNQFTKESLELPMDYRFPETFDNIIDETKSVIGLTVEEELVSKRFKELMDQDLDDSDAEEEDFDDEDGNELSDDSNEELSEDAAENNSSNNEELPHYREENTRARDRGQREYVREPHAKKESKYPDASGAGNGNSSQGDHQNTRPPQQNRNQHNRRPHPNQRNDQNRNDQRNNRPHHNGNNNNQRRPHNNNQNRNHGPRNHQGGGQNNGGGGTPPKQS